ncbi:MAG TPA: hypothetical protein VLL76_05595 [Candidatus Omnitrophota bacterium]|nr:hypothetical protein [Candidatus Omnitrophota bacterium]
MTKGDTVCPHCQSDRARLLSDHLGVVGWCSDCHRPWVPSQKALRPGAPPMKVRVTELRAAV